MKTMYWIEVLGNISMLATIFAAIFAITAMFILVVTAWVDGQIADTDDIKGEIHKGYKRSKKCGICAILFVLVAVFTPSTKSLYMIYGVGGTLDYLKANETAQQLPDKVVMALDKWVDSQIGDENKDNK